MEPEEAIHNLAASASRGDAPRASSTVRSSSRTSPHRRNPFRRRGWKITKEAKVLLIFIILFSVITTAQFVAAFIANSLTLLADCGAMTADVITYVVNFTAEIRRGKSSVIAKVGVEKYECIEMIVCFMVYVPRTFFCCACVMHCVCVDVCVCMHTFKGLCIWSPKRARDA